ncbi:MAG: 50S ribosomal protein L25 [Candidatus Nomurabacteria bacterium]|nr:50S ribosomal protein L25 [Candidatus Nomurabacteria bacterium]
MNKLTATKRSKTDKLATIRTNGMVPAVVYGARVENTMISVSSIDFTKILKVAGESSTIVLELQGDATKKEAVQNIDVLIHDMQVDPVKGFPIHVDFLAIDMNKEVEVTIPVEFTGAAPAEKNNLGVLVKVIHEVEVEALPKDLPHNVTVNVSTLVALDDQIHIKDIVLPKGVKMITDANEVVALITTIKEEVADSGPVDLASIEVEKRGKKEEDVA